MDCVDLSAAFDIMDVKLQRNGMAAISKRLMIIYFPRDFVTLIEIWFKERYFNVNVRGFNSKVGTSYLQMDLHRKINLTQHEKSKPCLVLRLTKNILFGLKQNWTPPPEK